MLSCIGSRMYALFIFYLYISHFVNKVIWIKAPVIVVFVK